VGIDQPRHDQLARAVYTLIVGAIRWQIREIANRRDPIILNQHITAIKEPVGMSETEYLTIVKKCCGHNLYCD
jgi:hypothetical protein